MKILMIGLVALLSMNSLAEEIGSPTLGSGVIDPNVMDLDGPEALGQLLRHEAIYGNIPAIKSLLQRGADINASGVYGETALDDSILYGRLQATLFLIQNHAAPDPVDDLNRTPLLRAAQDCNWRVVEALVKAGADINHADYSGATALINSVKSNCVHATASLLNLGKNQINLEAEDNSFHNARDYISDPYIQSLFDGYQAPVLSLP